MSKINKKRLKMAKKVIGTAFGCTQHPKVEILTFCCGDLCKNFNLSSTLNLQVWIWQIQLQEDFRGLWRDLQDRGHPRPKLRPCPHHHQRCSLLRHLPHVLHATQTSRNLLFYELKLRYRVNPNTECLKSGFIRNPGFFLFRFWKARPSKISTKSFRYLIF